MNGTKALTQLGFVTARGLDNGEYGAQLLANKVTTQLNSGFIFICKIYFKVLSSVK